MLDDAESALVDVDSATGIIRLTGSKDEIGRALGLLEVLGVPMVSTPPSNELPTPTQETDVPVPLLGKTLPTCTCNS